MDNIASSRGYPDVVRLDNGPEFISEALANWAVLHGVKLQFIQPGKPTQNSFIERFNRTFREEVLDFYLFKNLNEVRQISEQWLMQYNEERPPATGLSDMVDGEFSHDKVTRFLRLNVFDSKML